MAMCEELISGLVKSITGDYKIMYSPKPGMEEVEIDFKPPFKRISMMEGLEEKMNVKLSALDDPDVDAKLIKLLEKHGLECAEPQTTARLLDTFVGEFLEANIIHPTFITEHPQTMSPLAKYHRSKPFLTERFEMFAAGREVSWRPLFLFLISMYIDKLTYLTLRYSSAGQRLHRVEQPGCAIRTFPRSGQSRWCG
jgi:lysyl-tRNA synthetase class 2